MISGRCEYRDKSSLVFHTMIIHSQIQFSNILYSYYFMKYDMRQRVYVRIVSKSKISCQLHKHEYSMQSELEKILIWWRLWKKRRMNIILNSMIISGRSDHRNIYFLIRWCLNYSSVADFTNYYTRSDFIDMTLYSP